MKTIYLSIVLLWSYAAMSQHQESMFTSARKLAQQGEYSKAHLTMDSLLVYNQTNTEWIKYKANLYSWQQNNDSALLTMNKIVNHQTDVEAITMVAMFNFRNKQYQHALEYCLKALILKPDNIDALHLELDILLAMKRYKECYEKSGKLRRVSTKAKNIHNLCANKYLTKRVSIGFVSTTQDLKIRNRYNLQYQFSKKGITSISTLHATKQNNLNNLQFVQEVYRPWKKIGYSYGSFSFSRSPLFPAYSASLVHFMPVSKLVELDLGVRYFNGQTNQSSLVPSIGLAYTINSIVMNYRYYQVFGKQTKGGTHTMSVRKNLKQSDDFLKLDIGIGNQFDLYINTNTYYKINSKGFSLGAHLNKSITSRLKANIGILYSNTQINETFTRSLFTTTINLIYKLPTIK